MFLWQPILEATSLNVVLAFQNGLEIATPINCAEDSPRPKSSRNLVNCRLVTQSLRGYSEYNRRPAVMGLV